MIHYWWLVHVGPPNIQQAQIEAWKNNAFITAKGLLFTLVLTLQLMTEFVRKAIRAQKKKKRKRKRKNDGGKANFMVFFPHFCASLFSYYYYSARGWHSSPCTLLSTHLVVLGWELSSAAVWARDGSGEGEGVGDAERDLMRMYGRGCMCVSFSWHTHTHAST